MPDGDTGTNMSLTIGTAAAELRQKNPATVGAGHGPVRLSHAPGRPGNSGVILSLIFRGLFRAMKDKDTMDGIDLADAINAGVIAAYRAVMKPAEGPCSPSPAWRGPEPARRPRRTPPLSTSWPPPSTGPGRPWPIPSTRTPC